MFNSLNIFPLSLLWHLRAISKITVLMWSLGWSKGWAGSQESVKSFKRAPTVKPQTRRSWSGTWWQTVLTVNNAWGFIKNVWTECIQHAKSIPRFLSPLGWFSELDHSLLRWGEYVLCIIGWTAVFLAFYTLDVQKHPHPSTKMYPEEQSHPHPAENH